MLKLVFRNLAMKHFIDTKRSESVTPYLDDFNVWFRNNENEPEKRKVSYLFRSQSLNLIIL
jgi:hypothetical protein